MVEVAPFRAVRYRTADLADLTAPPYDAIDADLAVTLRQRSPHNVVRLELGETRDGDRPGADRYKRAADIYRRWQEDGVLARDAEPSLAVYEQHFDGRTQRGVLAAVRLVPWGEGSEILPHERVYRGPVEDRLRLLNALPVNLSPIYLLGREEPPAITELLDAVSSREPEIAFTDDEEHVRHRLWRIVDPAAFEIVSRAYAPEALLVADGHHRYTTALEFHNGSSAPGAGRILAFVAAPGPVGDGPLVRPMHRVLPVLADEPLRVLRSAGAGVEMLDAPSTGADAARLLGRLADLPEPAFVLATSAGAWAVTWPDPRAASGLVPADVHPSARTLEISVVEAAVSRLLAADGDTRPLPTPHAEHALAAVAGGTAEGAALVRAPGLADVRRVAEAGGLMPPKSTSFFPKPRTGLVLRPLDDIQ